MYGVLTSSTGKDLSAVFKSDLNIGEKKNYHIVVKPYSRDFKTCIKNMTKLAILGYCLKDDLKPQFKCVYWQYLTSDLHVHVCTVCVLSN
jgi:hypothetical protein